MASGSRRRHLPSCSRSQVRAAGKRQRQGRRGRAGGYATKVHGAAAGGQLGETNAHLMEQCRKRRDRKVWDQQETIAQRFDCDRERLLPLPAAPYKGCEGGRSESIFRRWCGMRPRLLGAGAVDIAPLLAKKLGIQPAGAFDGIPVHLLAETK